MKSLLWGLLLFGSQLIIAQNNYDTFFIGNTSDVASNPQGGVCLMGGATEDDNAMRWFLNRANGGDVLVLRTSLSDGYNDYFYTDLGVTVNSVETIRFNDPSAANDPYIRERIERAEAIWFAGGDQSRYVDYWRGTPVAEAINAAINNRNIVIGGTSAGMAILGGVYFTANQGTVLSDQALNNPYDERVAISNQPFLNIPSLDRVVTDMHYDDPPREGRHMTFLARAITDYGGQYYGIACDEYTAVCIDEFGEARVFGGYPNFADDFAYFLVPNCSVADNMPEQCVAGQPLSWNHGGVALTAYAIQGTVTGQRTFDTNTWETGEGGQWQYWSVDAGVLASPVVAENPDCTIIGTSDLGDDAIPVVRIYPNPASSNVRLESTTRAIQYRLLDLQGRLVHTFKSSHLTYDLNVQDIPSGTYLMEWTVDGQSASRRLLIR